MITSFHLASINEIDEKFIEKLRSTYVSNPITIIVEETETLEELSQELKDLLDERLTTKHKDEYITAEESIERLKKKYAKL